MIYLAFNEVLIVLDLGLLQGSPGGRYMFLAGVFIHVDPDLVRV